MPKKPPFSRFRKSCCSPSNSNKKKKKLQVPSVPCKKCACLYHRWVCGARGLQGAGVMFLVGLPAHKESMPAPEDHSLRAGTCSWHWYPCLQQRVHLLVFPHACRSRHSTHRRNTFPGLTGSTGAHCVPGILQESIISDPVRHCVP